VRRFGKAAARTREEDGGVLVIVATWLLGVPVLIVVLILVVDVGNWYLHKRHLQLQADAGALAGGGVFTVPCSDDAIVNEGRRYAGDPGSATPYNLQVAPTDQSNIHVLVNSASYWNEGGTDYSDGGPPCSAKFVDLKITEANLPWYFAFNVVPAFNAHARVSIQSLLRARGALPVAVPDIDPKVGRVFFIDEANGTVIASTPLAKTGFDHTTGLATWDNATVPASVAVNSARIGVRVALGGGSSTTCGGYLVQCYDLTSPNGIMFVRGYSTTGSGAPPNPPIARDVRLFSGSCPDPYFNVVGAACSFGVNAQVDFGTVSPTQTKVSAVVGGTEHQLQYDAGLGRWVSTSAGNSFFTAGPAGGPISVELKWEVNAPVTIGGNNCTTTGGNKCKGTFGILLQRTFSGSMARSGPIELAKISEGGFYGANSFALGTTHDLVVRIGIKGNLQEAQSVSDPRVELRVTGGSQNQSIDCDPALSNLRDEIREGCAPQYEINTGAACPPGASSLWSTPQPWDCVAIQTGGAVGQLEKGMQERILGGVGNTCTAPNNWASFPNLPQDDPRIVPVFVTPFGTFQGSGNETVPVSNFATFYVTGWDSSPCSGDDPVPGKGYIVGHFIKYIYALNTGGGSGEFCNFDAFGSCIAVMTE
jgi:putative Flp pilus-assembly TadE/G-like protein